MSFFKMQEKPLQIVGTINAYCAVMAQKAGFQALYLSGAGVANASYAIPDIGLTTLSQVLIDVERITSASSLPLLVDADTGFDDVTETVKCIEAAGASGLHIEDQVSQKKCGQLEGKHLVSTEEMVMRIKTAIAARSDSHFMIMARTDAISVEGLEAALMRAKAYEQAGADAIFVEAATELKHYRLFKEALDIPILANITEFGKTPLFTVEELEQEKVDMILYPLSAFRAMNQAALDVYETIKQQGTQRECLDKMQTREQLYRNLNYDVKK